VNKQKCFFVLYCLIPFLLTGCWDETNIEERGFIVGLAIDLADEQKNDNHQVTLTNQFVVPPGIGSPSDSGGGSQKAYLNLSASGDSIFAIDKEMRTSINMMPFFEHLKVIVVSEDVLNTPDLFPSLMDVFYRNREIRRVTKVIVTEGEAKQILDIAPENEKVPALYMDTLLEINLGQTGTLKPVQLGDIHEWLLTDSSFTIPKYMPSEQKINYEAGAVFHGYEGKLVGTLNKQEMQGLNLLMNEYQGGPIEFEHEGNLITFNITEANSKIKIDTKDQEAIIISVNINIEGYIAEVFGTEKIMNPKNTAELEKKAGEKVEEIVQKTIEKVQNELNTDVFGLKNKLKQKDYETWLKVKDNWDHGDNYFRESIFHVKAKARIRSIGDSEKSHKNG
jgi:spore germination protein